MKSILPILFLLLPSCCLAQGWNWGKNQQTLNKSVEAYAVAADGAGNVFGGGYTMDTGTIDFGNGVILTLPPRGGLADKRFLYVKYNSSGVAQWAGAATGTNWLSNMTTDAAGNLILFGSFYSTQMQIGSIIMDNPVGGTNRFFLAKISPTGTVLWATSDGDIMGDFISAFGRIASSSGDVTTDVAGDIYVIANFYKPTMTVGSTTLTNKDAAGSTTDIMIAKYSAAGAPLWAKSYGGSNYDFGNGIAVAPGGIIYVTGGFRSPTLIFGADTLTNTYWTSTSRAYIAKFSPTGDALWAQVSGGHNGAAGLSVGADKVGGIYVTGAFADSNISFGHTVASRPYPAAVPLEAQYLVRYSVSDTATWAKAFGSAVNGLSPYRLAVVPCGQVWVDAGDTGDVEIDGHIYAAAPGPDPLFIAGFEPSGRLVGYSSIATGGDDIAGIACDSVGHVAICGDMWSMTSVDMGADTITNSFFSEILFVGRYGGSVKDTFTSSKDTSVCGIASLLLTGAMGSSSYGWSDGSTNATLSVHASGTYIVHSYACGVVSIDTFHVTFLSHPCNIGVAEIEPVSSIELYPNPVQNILTVVGSGKVTSVSIFNLLGQTVVAQTFSQVKAQVDISGLLPGIYFIRVNGGEMRKIVKE